MDLTKYTTEELLSLRGQINNYLSNINDGYIYICNIRSYGSNWEEKLTNTISLEELCCEYNGDDGIIDIYTTNPNLNIHNYGDIFYIESEYDYREYFKYTRYYNFISNLKKDITEWQERDSKPFKYRPIFEPMYTLEELNEEIYTFEKISWDFVTPKSFKTT